MNWFRNFMYGRYGMDGFGIFLIVAAFLLSLPLRFTWPRFLLLFAYIPLVLEFARFVSRNIPQRARENEIFMRYWRPVWEKLKKMYAYFKGMQTHKYYKCPSCRQKLRVPRGRGKIEITCPKCQTKFIKKT
ncbi:MAG: zinc-ribbon domain-containing protein [Oscillospiraceae bacterium]|nr:zinc-ribbon domain-containing protein [Oscillospiraceae bacterium]